MHTDITNEQTKNPKNLFSSNVKYERFFSQTFINSFEIFLRERTNKITHVDETRGKYIKQKVMTRTQIME